MNLIRIMVAAIMVIVVEKPFSSVTLIKMFLSKVNDQKLELLRAVFKNMYLKEKCDYLDGECKMLAEHLISSQIVKAEQSETKLVLNKDLDNLRQLQEQKSEELAMANEKIIAMSLVLDKTMPANPSLRQNESIDEELSIKDDMIKCLQEELVHVRLDQAEKWAIIRDLKQTKNELEKEKEIIATRQPETVSRLQEELMIAKLLETQYVLEFEDIKKQLANIKSEIQQCQNQDCNHGNKRRKKEGDVKLSKKGVLWLKSSEKDDSDQLLNIKKLEEEKLFLQNRIPELEKKIEIINKHIRLKEDERWKLQQKMDSVKIKQQSVENIILERRRQYVHLEKNGSERVFGIRNSSSEKKQDIEELSNKLENISSRRESPLLGLQDTEELNIVEALEKQILLLQEKIDQLNSEVLNLQHSALSRLL